MENEFATRTHARAEWVRAGAVAFAIAAAAASLAYWRVASSRVYVDTATVQAPLIELSPSVGGKLERVFVNEGDFVAAEAPVAQVGNELVKAKVAGRIVSLPDMLGAQVPPDQAVAEMIDPSKLRVVGKVDEDKGLSRIRVGDPVSFTVDAFGSRAFEGVVDEVSQTSAESGIVFNISDQRQVQQFAVKARFDTGAYPELKNGMSARMWVYDR